MAKQMIPFCFHPTTTVVVDDDPSLAQWLSVQLEGLGPSVLYTAPEQALEAFSRYKPDFFTKRVASSYETFDISHHDKRSLEIDLTKIHQEIHNAEHDQQIAVVIVDYAMPGMTGLEFCHKIRDLPVKKILLTGEADYTIAVGAFNDGLIDRFILKSDPDLLTVIERSVFELQFAYFQDLSRLIFDSMVPRDRKFTHCLSDSHFFTSCFLGVLKRLSIKEFYLWDHAVNFLLKDAKGVVSWMMIRDDVSALDTELTAEQVYNEQPTPQGLVILEQIRSRKKMPFFYPYYNETWSLEDWAPYLHEVQIAEGDRGVYYVAIVPESALYAL